MAQVAHEQLSIGQQVWYRYSHYTQASGPYKVKGFWGGHDGYNVILSGELGKPDLNIALADDEDFGLLLFYDSDPNEAEER